MPRPGQQPLRLLRRDVSGASLVEYLLIVAVIALVALAGFRAFGERARARAARLSGCVATLDAACSDADTGAPTNVSAGTSASGVDARPTAPADGGFVRGFFSQGWQDVSDLAKLAYSAMPTEIVRSAVTGTPNRAVEAVKGVAKLAISATPYGRMVAARGGPDPIADVADGLTRQLRGLRGSWERAPSETLGRGVFEAATWFLPFAKVGKVAETASAIGKVEEVARASETMMEAAGSVARVAEAAKPLAGSTPLALGFFGPDLAALTAETRSLDVFDWPLQFTREERVLDGSDKWANTVRLAIDGGAPITFFVAPGMDVRAAVRATDAVVAAGPRASGLGNTSWELASILQNKGAYANTTFYTKAPDGSFRVLTGSDLERIGLPRRP